MGFFIWCDMIKNSKKTEIKVGIITVLSIIIFVFGLALVRNIGVGADMKPVTMKFQNSGGLKVSDPIVINGVEQGYVVDIISRDGFVIVSGEINAAADIRKDASAQISMLEITGGKKVEINPGIDREAIQTGVIIPGLHVAGIPELLTDAGLIAADLRKLIQKLDTTASGINQLLADQGFINDIKTTVTTSKEAVVTLNRILQDGKSDLVLSLKNLKSASQSLKEMIQKYEPKADTLLDNLSGVLSSADNLISKTGNIADNANVLIGNFNDIAINIKQGNGIVTTLLYDKKFNDELRKSFENLDKFIQVIRKHGVNVNVRIGTQP